MIGERGLGELHLASLSTEEPGPFQGERGSRAGDEQGPAGSERANHGGSVSVGASSQLCLRAPLGNAGAGEAA